jgi:hypothetical protein
MIRDEDRAEAEQLKLATREDERAHISWLRRRSQTLLCRSAGSSDLGASLNAIVQVEDHEVQKMSIYRFC